MKVIGAGYGRTGTKSLQLALQQLGFGKCYHMEELFRNPNGVKHWINAYRGDKVDWDALFPGYQAIVDFPGSMYYKQLADHYPDSKIILTVRDPEKWYDSVRRTIYLFDPGPAIKIRLLFKMIYSTTARNLFKAIQLNDKSIWNKYFEGKFEDRAYAIQKFTNHIEEVKKSIPAERLLIFESKDGWEPLCKFLGVDAPKEPYPRTNLRANFSTWAKGIVKDVLKTL
ncbi:MAG: sulfotransferase family protein [Bacteroidia bacterium]|nr:sulfotransferase family protein [Bacteroidia bacterium]